MSKMTWFKLHSDFRNDPKIKRLPIAERYAFIILLCLANESETRGIITGLDDDDIAFELEMQVEDWKTLRSKFKIKGFIDFTQEQILIRNWDKRQYDKPSDHPDATKERKRLQREKEKLLKEQAVTPMSRDVTRCHATEERESRLDQKKVDEEKEISFAQENNFKNLQGDPQDSEISLPEKKIESLALENKPESEDLKTTPLPPSKNSIQSFEDRMRSGSKSWIWQRKISDRPEWSELLTDWAKSKDCKLGFKNSLIEAQKAFLKKRNLTCDHAAAMNSLSNYIKADDLASFMIRADEAIAIEQSQHQRSQQQPAPIAVQEPEIIAPIPSSAREYAAKLARKAS
jgi:hypothetical protein